MQRLLNPAAEDLLARLRPMAVVQEQAAAAKGDRGLWAGPRYTTHPLIREVAAEMLASRSVEERMQACRAFVHFMLSCGKEMGGVGLEAQITQELLSLELVNICELARLLAELACEILGPQHPVLLVGLAELLWDHGQLVAAAELGRATLRALEPDHSELEYAESCLKDMLSHDCQMAQSEKLARETLWALNASLANNHADIVDARENLALTLLQQDASRLPLRLGSLPPVSNRKGKGVGLKGASNKGALGKPQGVPGYVDEVDYSQREALQDQAFSIAEDDEVGRLQLAVLQAREAAQGSEHPDTIFARANLAATLCQRGQVDQAAELLRSVVAAQVQLLGEGHPDTARTRTELTKVLGRSDLSARAVGVGHARRSILWKGMGWASFDGTGFGHMQRRRSECTLRHCLRQQTWQPRMVVRTKRHAFQTWILPRMGWQGYPDSVRV